MPARLIITTSSETLQTPLPPAGRLVLGCDAESCDILLPEKGVLPLHAALIADEAGVTLEDLGGGVRVNGRAVGEQRLEPGDVVQIGAAELRFELDPQPAVRLSKDGLDLASCTLSGVQPIPGAVAEARLGLLLQMAQTVGADLTHQQVLDKLMELLFTALRPERAVLARVDAQGQLSFEAAQQESGREPWSELQVSGTILTRVIHSGEAFITADAGRAEGMEQVRSIASKGIRSAMCAPFHLRGAVAGALYADHRGAINHFDEADLDFMIMISHLASVAIQNVVDYQAVQQENRRLRELAAGQQQIIGASEAIQRLHQTVAKVARSELPVLVQGERGTGKELVAQSIHQLSGRGTFVPVNCAAIPESLAESVLFGHEQGAFTGAERQHLGYFEQANGGTLFLDEIGDLKAPSQAAILRALQESEIRRVGAASTITVDVRVVAATNRDLAQAIDAGTFRGDLYDRLNVLPLSLPPLRERADDIPLLAAHFARDRVRRISAKALQLLRAHSWQGNVRELKNVIERAIVMGDGETIWPEDLPPAVREGDPARHHLATLEALERDHIIRVLRSTRGNVSLAAKILGIRRVTIYKKLKTYGLEPAEFKAQG